MRKRKRTKKRRGQPCFDGLLCTVRTTGSPCTMGTLALGGMQHAAGCYKALSLWDGC